MFIEDSYNDSVLFITVYVLCSNVYCSGLFKGVNLKSNTCVKNPRVTLEYTLPPPTTTAAEIVDTEVHPS